MRVRRLRPALPLGVGLRKIGLQRAARLRYNLLVRFAWPGGSLVVNDLERRMTIAYMMNRMAPGIIGSARSEAYVRACYRALQA